jgi:hypothetical protein
VEVGTYDVSVVKQDEITPLSRTNLTNEIFTQSSGPLSELKDSPEVQIIPQTKAMKEPRVGKVDNKSRKDDIVMLADRIANAVEKLSNTPKKEEKKEDLVPRCVRDAMLIFKDNYVSKRTAKESMYLKR